MKILLTGANGFLGIHLTRQILDQGYELTGTGRAEQSSFSPSKSFTYEKMDITDPYAVHDVFEKHEPEVVIHAAAMSKVDECEQQQWAAYTTNVEATLTLLSNAAERKCFFIFISTDFVFDGEKGNYAEEDSPGPVNFYGKTKAEAEEAVSEYEYDWSIIRTSLVYGKAVKGKGNVLSVVRDKLIKMENYGLVNDQFRSPTYVEDLAKGIMLIIENKARGIFHISGKDILTPYQMGIAVAHYLDYSPDPIRELSSLNFSQPAKRPARTNLNIEKAKTELGYDPVNFEEGLRKTFS